MNPRPGHRASPPVEFIRDANLHEIDRQHHAQMPPIGVQRQYPFQEAEVDRIQQEIAAREQAKKTVLPKFHAVRHSFDQSDDPGAQQHRAYDHNDPSGSPKRAALGFQILLNNVRGVRRVAKCLQEIPVCAFISIFVEAFQMDLKLVLRRDPRGDDVVPQFTAEGWIERSPLQSIVHHGVPAGQLTVHIQAVSQMVEVKVQPSPARNIVAEVPSEHQITPGGIEFLRVSQRLPFAARQTVFTGERLRQRTC